MTVTVSLAILAKFAIRFLVVLTRVMVLYRLLVAMLIMKCLLLKRDEAKLIVSNVRLLVMVAK